MNNYIDDYLSICRNFNMSDLATRRNIQSVIAPRLQELRRELTEAIWKARQLRCPIPREDRQAMIKEARIFGNNVRSALARIRDYEATVPG